MMKSIKKITIWSISIFTLLLLITYFSVSYFQEPKSLEEKEFSVISGKFVNLSSGYTHYEHIVNDTGTTTVFIHGAGAGYFIWDNNFEWLQKKGVNVLRYDLYGRGYSQRPNVDYNIHLFRKQLEELLYVLKIKGKINIVAASMGATVALDYIDHYPNKINKLILIDPASVCMGKAPWYIEKPIISDLLFTFYWRPRAVHKQMKEFYNPSNVSEFKQKTLNQMQYQGYKNAIKSTWIHTMGNDMSVSLKNINNINVNLIWGKNDPLVPYKAAETYQKLLKNSTLDLINEAGHLSCYERPDIVNPLLLKYLQ